MAQRKPGAGIVPEVKPAFEEITRLVDTFCREHLNEEYATLCVRLAEKLARKRPSPLVSGKRTSWACGIVRAIGWTNFLDDSSQTPHMKTADIDKAFGVSESTGHAKSMAIRKMLRMRPLDPEWSIASRLENNPMVWLVSVNGFVMDARDLPYPLQEAAFRKGLIPYIPDDALAETANVDEIPKSPAPENRDAENEI